MTSFFQNVLTASFHGSIVILAVLLLRLILRKTPKKYICFLWMLAGLRLLMPVPLQSSFSLQPRTAAIPVPWNLSGILPAVWIGIAVCIGAYSAVSYFQLRSKVSDAVKVPGGWESDRIETAFVLGFIRPRIYIPTGMSGDTRKQILSHERTHLDKGDHWIKMIGFLALALHWFNPLVWLSYVLLCKDIEMACDERVVQFMELDERKAYSSALLQCSTNRVHYAACPVAFGEVSVKYRIKSVLGYRKPGFWISLLGVLSIAFVGLCLLTSPAQADTDSQLRNASRLNPGDFAVPAAPYSQPNPDWGLDIIVDASTVNSGIAVYIADEQYMSASNTMKMEDGYLERWNGSSWEKLPTQSSTAQTFVNQEIYFAEIREMPLFTHSEELNWMLTYGTLPAGDYRLVQTISSDTDTAIFRTPFHIYRETLPSEEETALRRCSAALDALVNADSSIVTLSEKSPSGTICPVRKVSRTNGHARIDYFLGSFQVGTTAGDDAVYGSTGWEQDFLLNRNCQYLFPKGQSLISESEVTFCSAWADHTGQIYHGVDTYCFREDGRLLSVERTVRKMDAQGNVEEENVKHLDAETVGMFFLDVDDYQPEDSFTAQQKSPWGIFFRVDDDYLKPTGGEVWLGTNAVGVSNYTTDCSFWLEKRVDTLEHRGTWQRVGGDVEGSWGNDTLPVRTRTLCVDVDWSETYGSLSAGIYRMGKRFYNGSDSMIQYAEFSIGSEGGIFGTGGEEALARVDAAIEKLLDGTCRVEVYSCVNSPYTPMEYLYQVIWHDGETEVTDVYHNDGYSHSYSQTKQDGFGYADWSKRSFGNEAYDSYYFDESYSTISDREISFAHCFGFNSWCDPCVFYTYLFDDDGNLTGIERHGRSGDRSDYSTRYVITDTPGSEIRSWIEQHKN